MNHEHAVHICNMHRAGVIMQPRKTSNCSESSSFSTCMGLLVQLFFGYYFEAPKSLIGTNTQRPIHLERRPPIQLWRCRALSRISFNAINRPEVKDETPGGFRTMHQTSELPLTALQTCTGNRSCRFVGLIQYIQDASTCHQRGGWKGPLESLDQLWRCWETQHPSKSSWKWSGFVNHRHRRLLPFAGMNWLQSSVPTGFQQYREGYPKPTV